MRKCCLRAGGVAIAAAFLFAAPAASRSPSLVWQGASQVRVQCLVAPTGEPASARLQAALCARIAKAAASGAPIPVSTVAFGDPEVIAPGTVALLVHGQIETEGARRLLAFSIRPYRNSANESSVQFGAPPRAATLTEAGAPSPALDAAIGAALREVLPWQSRPATPSQATKTP